MPEQQQDSMKVYELAKELGLDSFALLDKLKQINIEVKSHMSSLASDQADAIRAALRKEKSPGAGSTVKKRAAAGATAKETVAPAAAPTAKKVVKKAATPAAADAPEKKPVAKESAKAKAVESEQAATPAAASKRKVIKRRSGEGETETSVGAESSAPTASAHDATTQTFESKSEDTQDAALVDMQAPAPAPAEPVNPNAPGTRAQRSTVARTVDKDELLDEFTSRRLKIVQAAPPASELAKSRPGAPTYRTPGGPVGGEKRKTSGAAGAAGAGAATGAAPTGDMFQPFTSYTQKEEEGKTKRGMSTRTQTPEEIRIADFRKRELVFQPKRKKLPPGKMVKRTEITEMAAHKKKIRIDDKIVVSELAQRMGEKANTILGKLMQMGSMVTINQTIDFDTASLLANEFGWEVENIAFKESEVLTGEADANAEDTQSRPPIITVMGHVDHGKTSLLDTIRNADVVSGEAGGITQHIGAYSVNVDGRPITFLDTPGHEAFANMRSRGANLTDIVILVVAADDSIMPQTKEAIAHAQNAKVPMIVAANKMDKPAANIEKVKKDLSAHNVLVEDWGGEVPLVPVSALKKTGIKELLETILIQSEVMDLKANPERAAEGVTLEARMEKGRGVVTDLLVRKGTLKTGDHLVIGTAYGRVRAMTNDKGQSITEVKPGFPAEVIGLTDVPAAGEPFYVVKNEEMAKELVQSRRQKQQDEKALASAPKALTLDELMSKLPTPGLKELNIIVKADVFGSAEAIKESIEKIQSDKVKAKVIQCTVGVITENDVLMAKTANALILGFNSKPDSKARDTAKREKVEIKSYSIIYQLLDDVRAAMENLLEPLRKETLIGKAEVKQAFSVSKLGMIAGSTVIDGKIVRNAFAKVVRGKDVVAEGKVISLKRFKDDASETIKGQECGIGVENFEKFLPGDQIHAFHVELVKQTL